VKLTSLNPKAVAAVLYAGGHGTMWDFVGNEGMDKFTAAVFENGGVVASVCHGPAALVDVKLSNGDYLVKGKTITCFTNSEEDTMNLSAVMPFMLETKLKEQGAKWGGGADWSSTTQVTGNLVTG
jgi:putative intracellular protease/amidase